MSFNPNEFKVFTPDAFAFCTPWHKLKTFSNYKVLNEVFQYPIENKRPTKQDKLDAKIKLGLNPYKKHILNVGLWTPGKNQKEGLQIAKLFLDTNPEIEFHFVGNYAPNFEDYWKPLFESCPKNVKIWGERNDIETFMIACDMFMFNSTWECNPLVLRDAASYGMRILSRNLPQYLGMFDLYITPIDDDIIKTKELILLRLNLEKPYSLDNNQSQIFAEQFVRFYKEVNNLNIVRQKRENKIKIVQHFVDQPFLEILGNSDKKYLIKFFDESGICHYTNEISSNCWVKLNRCYYTKWNTKIWEDGELIYDETLNYENKRVFISFESKSLGDTLAWIPYVQEFKNKHNCHVVVSTFWNKLFKYSYPELEFTEPGTVVYNLHGLYRLGWFYDKDKEPILPNVIPLQKTATNILGLEYVEIKPTLDFKEKKRPIKEKYVTIANESTSGCKYWNYPNGWQELVDYLISKGYKVINVSKNGDKLKNVEKLSNTSIENTMNFIYHSEFFIGLSSGLSWLSWALGKHVVLISNFTEIDHEFTTNTTRIYNHDVCNSCWNNPLFKFDKGDWNWCPEHKNTDRQFECHKSITTEMVINKIKKFLK
jgi:autotransporter strand-loop-strand O-heptosyltransferase